jgi:ribosomal protein S18 acetylase RimI-like enzyme
MEEEPRIVRGVCPAERATAARILYEGLDEIRIIFGPPDRALRSIARMLREERALTALINDHVVGMAGLNYGGKGSFDVGFLGMNVFRGFKLVTFRVAFLGIIFEEHTAKDEMYLDSLAVSAGFRGRGIGRKLVESACEQAKTEGLDCVRLHVIEPNVRAKALYERLGFETIRFQRIPCLWRRAFRFNGFYEMGKHL